MADKRQKITGRRTGPTFGLKPHHIFKADCKNETPSPASVLSHMAANMLDNLTVQFNGFNNGDLCAAPKIMKLYGWNSQGSINKALTELLALGFIEQTRQGGRNKCSLFALTWLAIDECKDKLDISPTRVASNLWKPENAGNIDPRFKSAWQKLQELKIATNKPKNWKQLPLWGQMLSLSGQVNKQDVVYLLRLFTIRTSHGLFKQFCCHYKDSFIDIPYIRDNYCSPLDRPLDNEL